MSKYIEEDTGHFFEPKVNLEPRKGFCEIVGESYPEKADDFYKPLIAKIETHLQNTLKPFNLDIRLTYFNTSSFKEILKLLKILRSFQELGKKIYISWHYPVDDLDLLIEIQDLAEGAKIDINLIPYYLDY